MKPASTNSIQGPDKLAVLLAGLLVACLLAIAGIGLFGPILGFAPLGAQASQTNANGLVLADGKGYPYSASDNSASHPYIVSIYSHPSDPNSIYKIRMTNQLESWALGVKPGPLYPATVLSDGSPQKLTTPLGTTTDTAVFGNAFPANASGKRFVKAKFNGFIDNNTTRSQIVFGKMSELTSHLDDNTNGGIAFRGYDGAQHYIPFYVKLVNDGADDSSGAFSFDGSRMFYHANFPSNTFTFRLGRPNGPIAAYDDVNQVVSLPMAGGGTIKYQAYVNNDIITSSASSYRLWLLLKAGYLGMDDGGQIESGNRVAFLGTANNSVLTQKQLKVTLDDFVTGKALSRKMYGSTMWSPQYVPQSADFSNYEPYVSNNPDFPGHFTAVFRVTDTVSSGDIFVYIDTKTGGSLGDLTVPDKTMGYLTSVDYKGTPSWSLTRGSGTDFLQAGYTDAGTKVWLNGIDNGATISMPADKEKVGIDVTVGNCATTVNAVAMDSRPNKIELTDTNPISSAKDNSLHRSQLDGLYSGKIKERVSGSETSIMVNEGIGLSADAIFDSTAQLGHDLVTYIPAGGFYYEVTLGDKGVSLGTPNYTADANDNVTLPLFGRVYRLKSARLGTGPRQLVFERTDTSAICKKLAAKKAGKA